MTALRSSKPTAPASERLKLLFLLPFAPDLRGSHGGARATASIIDMLSQHHCTSALYLVGPGDPPPRHLPRGCEPMLAVSKERHRRASATTGTRLLRAVGKFIRPDPKWVEECRSGEIARQIAAVVAEFQPDVVHIEFHVMAQYIPVMRAAWPRAAVVVTEHEPGISADSARGASPSFRQRIGALRRRRAWRRYERRTLPQADAIVTFTATDAAGVRAMLAPSSPPITIIPLRLPEDRSSPTTGLAPVRSDFLFVGNFMHPPNADAARRLVDSIFPMILRHLPAAKLTIVGPNVPDDVLAAQSDSVSVTGWVDDPSTYLAGAAVVLAPLRQGGGLRVKILEACAAGKAIVASPTAVEGLSLKHGEQIMIAETDEEFAKAAVALIEDSEARARLEAASRRWSDEEQDSTRWLAEYAELYASLPIGSRRKAR